MAHALKLTQSKLRVALDHPVARSIDRILTAALVWVISFAVGLFICAMVLVSAGLDKSESGDYRLVLFAIASVPAWILTIVCLWKRVRGMSLIWRTFWFFGELIG